jgi:D-alanyl-D-alanine carboxypeptidase
MTRLVNAQNPLPENFTVETVNITGYDERPFDKRAAPDLEALLADAEAAGCKLYLVSGYRSVERQTALFRRKTNAFLAEGFDQAEAERQAAMWVARPGTSEHNTGLAADLVSADWYAHHNDLTADFDTTPEFEWLLAHCAEYGFILRYPKEKENITGVTYEPWHYRYVGKQAAADIMRSGGTLEEYTESPAPSEGPALTEPWSSE